MSRVHDALRRAEMGGMMPPEEPPADPAEAGSLHPDLRPPDGPAQGGTGTGPVGPLRLNIHPGMLTEVQVVPFSPAPESHLLDLNNSHETPAEEFRTLRTRLNHLQSLQPIHSIVVTSPSPAEGKSFTAVNLALAESHLAGNLTLLADFYFRRPIIHNMFQVDRSPGITDYLLGRAALHELIKKIAGTNLYI